MLDQTLQPEINSKHTCEVHFQSTTDNVLMTFFALFFTCLPHIQWYFYLSKMS